MILRMNPVGKREVGEGASTAFKTISRGPTLWNGETRQCTEEPLRKIVEKELGEL